MCHKDLQGRWCCPRYITKHQMTLPFILKDKHRPMYCQSQTKPTSIFCNKETSSPANPFLWCVIFNLTSHMSQLSSTMQCPMKMIPGASFRYQLNQHWFEGIDKKITYTKMTSFNYSHISYIFSVFFWPAVNVSAWNNFHKNRDVFFTDWPSESQQKLQY